MDLNMFQKIKSLINSLLDEWRKTDIERHLSKAKDHYDLERLEREYHSKINRN